MNCFNWQKDASDYLDGILAPPEREAADKHLAECKTCSEKHQRYRLLITSIASQPRASLPLEMKKSPFSSVLPRFGQHQPGKSRFDFVPWYIRTTVEGTAIIAVILLTVTAGPRMRSLYEHSIEKSLSDFSDSNGLPADAVENAPLARGNVIDAAPIAGGADTYAGEDDNAASESDAGEVVVDPTSNIRVGTAEIWRFNLKSDSPRAMRTQVAKILAAAGISAATPGLGGIEAPGGIQFDILVPQAAIPVFKRELQKIAPAAPLGVGDNPMAETFTWYKNKSKAPMPSGKSRVVIWLSQI